MTFHLALWIMLAYQPATDFDAILERAYPQDGPGAAALVARGDQILYRGARGMADLELGVALEPHHVFRLGSITKQFTAAAIMRLMEQGKLQVNDPISKFLTDYPNGDQITVEHLLTHTPGIVSYTAIPGYMATKLRRDLSVEQLVAVFSDLPPEFDPGTAFKYNNSGYVLLGAIIEKISGSSYADYIQNAFFQPLEMTASTYGSFTRLIPNRVSGYWIQNGTTSNAPYISMTQPYAAGSLLSTVDDMYKWNRALYAGKVVSKQSLKQMTTSYHLPDGEETGYGYGLAVGDIRGHQSIGHGGGIHGFTTQATYLPEEEVFVVVLSNGPGISNPQLVANELAAQAVGNPFPVRTGIKLEEAKLARYVGVYRIDEHSTRTVSLDNGSLHTQRSGGGKLPITPFTDTGFFYQNSHTYLEFVVEDGEVIGMDMYHNGSTQPKRAVLTDEEPQVNKEVEVDAATLKTYVGNYEIRPGFVLAVSYEDGRLHTQATGQAKHPIFASSDTEFFVKAFDAQLSFELDEHGSPSAVILHQGGQDTRAEKLD